MNENKLREILADITMENTALDFKWTFRYESLLDKGWLVWVEFERPDTFSNQIGIGAYRKEFVSVDTKLSGVVKTCWLLIELTIRHELMEAFKWRGKRIFNPHNTVSQLASLQK